MRGEVTSSTHVSADLPALSDEGGVDIEAEGGQVLAEDAVGERASELGLPGVEILAGVGVDRLVGPAVGLRIADGITGGTASSRCRAPDREVEPARPTAACRCRSRRCRCTRWPSAGRCSRRGALPCATKDTRRLRGRRRAHRADGPMICSERCEFCSERNGR